MTVSNRKRPQLIRIQKNSPYYRMSYRGYIPEARLNMAKYLDRCIGSDEYIYFIDGDSFNASVSNLWLVSHKELTKLNEIRRITTQIGRLSARLAALEGQLAEIKFYRILCDCSKCKRSIDSRQAEYKL